MRILRAVDDLSRDKAPSIREVAERLGMEHSNTSRAVDQAIEADLLAKHSSTADRRRLELTLTDKGHQTIADLNRRRDEVHRELMVGWDEHEAQTLAGLLEKLVESYARVLGRPS
nr:MarR family transcriptional regulator [Rhodococcus sp. 14C212]